MVREEIKKLIEKLIKKLQKEKKLPDFRIPEIRVETPEEKIHGDYATNVAMVIAKQVKKNPMEIANLLGLRFKVKGLRYFDKVEVKEPGFVNFFVSKEHLIGELRRIEKEKEKYGTNTLQKGRKIIVEYAHPNTHKEMHIGHMRTLITGEALARIFQACGAKVFRANYQGDIGPHVAKAIWGTEKILHERGMSWSRAEKLNLLEKAHILGEGYVKGNQEYAQEKTERIDELNLKLYHKEKEVIAVYQRTRKWSLDYYDVFYKRFGTKFDKLYFESEVAEQGKKTVLQNIGKVFEESEGAVIFDGEKYGLHTRVFITKDGNPTYEAKEMGLVPLQYKNFPFDLNIHVVGSDQSGYFQVVFKALELVDEKFKGRQYHLPMGMVQLVGKKMSSRTGIIVTVDGLLDEVKHFLTNLITNEELTVKEKEEVEEKGTIAAVKYSVLKTDTKSNVLFDMERSVALDGNSGPYLLYTYARCKSVLRKAQNSEGEESELSSFPTELPREAKVRKRIEPSFDFAATRELKTQNDYKDFSKEELDILRTIYKFPEIVQEAADRFSPNLICNFTFDLAQKYNLFYNLHPIIKAKTEELKIFRLTLTAAVAQVLKNSLFLLGISAPEKM